MTRLDLRSTAPVDDGDDDFLVRARRLIEQAIRRRWDEGSITRDPDGAFTAYLGAEEIERLMGADVVDVTATGDDDEDWTPDGPLGVVSRRLGLRASEVDFLAVLLACESDPLSARLVTYLGGNQAPLALTFELVLEIVYRARYPRRSDAAAAMFRDFGPERALRRLRYVLLDGADKRVSLAQVVRLDGRLVSWLLGSREMDPELAPFAHLFEPGDHVPDWTAVDLLTPVVGAFRAGHRLVHVEGPPRSGRVLTLRQAASALGRPLLVVNGAGLGPDRVVLAFREASLRDALLAFTEGDEAFAGDGLRAMRGCLPLLDDTVAVVGCRDSVPALAALRPTTTCVARVPPPPAREELWRDTLGPDVAILPDELRQVASLYNLGVSGVLAASAAAREMAEFAGTWVDRPHIRAAVRQLFDSDLSKIARRVEVHQTWDDCVLPEDLERSVRSIVDRVNFRGRVLDEWGFGRKIGKGHGLTVLFSGEPGTGKSMVAGLVAAELGLDLYVVDLSQVASKWLGETEKNLGRTFDAAESGHAMLLFDEADSLLAKRTGDVKSSNDRYANLETNFILARLEQFEGIAFFTTNLASAIDPAVARRMSVHLRFPFPDVETRAALWRTMLPIEAPVAPDVDYLALAHRYELSGGFIRNIALRAAYLAARTDLPIGMGHLDEAAEMEYRERGALASGGRLV